MVYRSMVDEDEGDLLTGTRVCRACGERKPMGDFYWTSNRKHRVRGCAPCVVVRARTLREENRTEVTRRAFVKNLRESYGMTEQDYRTLWDAQGGQCAVCRTDLNRVRAPHVDHCHESDEVRGLLCFLCNTAIGKMRDDPALLRSAAEYLERPRPVLIGCLRRLTAEEKRANRSAAARRTHANLRGQEHLRARQRGEQNPATRLTDTAAAEIVSRYRAGGVTQAVLAAEFGCSQSCVSRLINGFIRSAVA